MLDVIISVDAGGSSTRYFIIDKDKNVLKKYKTGSGSPAVNINATDDIYNKIEEIYEENKNDINLKAVVIGMSGVALVKVDEYKQKIKDRFKCEVIIESDADMALYSVLEDDSDNGIVIISGTGAIVFAKNNGKTFFANGWGVYLGERGSAYSTMRDVVIKLIMHYEQYGTYTELGEKLIKHMGYVNHEDFKFLFYRHGKNEVAKHAVFIKEEANKGDKEAIEQLEYNGKLLANDVVSTINRTNMDKTFLIGFRGGFIEDCDIMKNTIVSELKSLGYNPIVRDEEKNPIFGGYYLAKRKEII